MKAYKVAENAGYHGCGVAFGRVRDGQVVELAYIPAEIAQDYLERGIIPASFCDPDDGVPNTLNYNDERDGDKYVALAAESELGAKDIVLGMCSCWELCVE